MILDADSVPPQHWKNGGGLTRELLRWPAAAPDSDWRLRLSVAEIARDGPFSPFPGVRRWFVVLAGAGVVLSLPGGERVLRPGDSPLCFDGAAAPGCRLLAGPTSDLNLMLKGLEGELRAAAAGEAAPAGWPQTGFFETAARRLHWPLAGAAPADGYWIGAAA
jgi:environmental stress-induced protein Ves